MSALLLCALLTAQNAPHELKLDTHGLDGKTTRALRITLRPNARVPEAALRQQTAVVKDAVTVVVPLASATDAPRPGHSAASFAIDFDEPPVKALVTAIMEKHGATPALEQLVDAVDAHISNKNGLRGMDVASVVARRRDGDCTEHAMLMTAVARAFGRPARVVMGLVLMEPRPGKLGAFGHAWSEVYVDGAWRIADAALNVGPGHLRHHVPLGIMELEGMSFVGGILGAAGPMDITRLEALAAAR